MTEFHLSHLPEVRAAIAAAAACDTIEELHAAAIAFDVPDLAKKTPARPGGPGPRCTATRPVMFLGKSPAGTEEASSIPFSGPAGQMLRKAVSGIGYDVDAGWLTCASYWRPRKDHTPNATQLAWSRPFLHREIAIAKPAVIVVLGEKALDGLMQETDAYTPKIGTWRTFDPEGDAIPALVTHNHAAVMYEPATRLPVFQDNLRMAAAAHPDAFATLLPARALAA